MAGYSPASNLSSNLPQSTIVTHDRNFVDNLKAETPFVRCSMRRKLPLNSGNQLRLYEYNAFGANLTQQPEGVVGSGLTATVLTITATIGNYADYANISKYAMQTALDDALKNITTEMAYRVGQTLSIIVRNLVDGYNSIDSSVAQSLAFNTPPTKNALNTMAGSLAGRNVKAFDAATNRNCGIIHHFVVTDMMNDNSNNSVTDIMKHTTEGQDKLMELPGPDSVPCLEFFGCRWYTSTLVTQTANYQGHGGTALRTYLFAKDGVITISLGDTDQVGDGDYRNMKLFMNKWDNPSPSDPANVIGGSCAYNINGFTATPPPDTTMRARYMDSQPVTS